MAKQFTFPKVWSTEELLHDKAAAEAVFRTQRREEGPKTFAAKYHETEPVVRDALELTDDLRGLTGDCLAAHPKLWRTLRYFCAPPVSEEDLWTLVGAKFKILPPKLAGDAATALLDVIDAIRFPWLAANRPPTKAERHAAILATTSMLSLELLRTERRGKSSRGQEDAVAVALATAGFNRAPVSKQQQITVLDVLERGSYSKERKVAGAKCDVPIRLHDGRLLAAECKVSNGPKNSWKRLSREVGGKANFWRERFGTQVITAAVLAGVFDLSCLQNAQAQDGVYIFWQHDLQPLADFVSSATP